MSIEIKFTPWRPFRARKDSKVVKRWLKSIGDAGVQAFKAGMKGYPPASAGGAWPHSRTGRLKGTIRSEVGGGGSFVDQVTIGTSMPYSKFLREGTRKMERRKMSDDALKEGMKKARLGRWVEWSRF